jgi:hypothetical protein
MAVSETNLGIRGPSSPDLGQERPTDRVRAGAGLDLGIREDADIGSRITRIPPSAPWRRDILHL